MGNLNLNKFLSQYFLKKILLAKIKKINLINIFKKKLQKIFKEISYSLFFIIYGRIKKVIAIKDDHRINLEKITFDQGKSYNI